MKIQYINGQFHGYNAQGEPVLCDAHQAATFKTKKEALEMVAHDGAQFGFWPGSFQIA